MTKDYFKRTAKSKDYLRGKRKGRKSNRRIVRHIAKREVCSLNDAN